MEQLIPQDWREALAAEFDEPYWRELEAFVAEERERFQGFVYPPEADVFRALELTRLADVKCVLIAQDPYIKVDQAHGLCFSVADATACQFPPSLRNIYTELEADDVPFVPPNRTNPRAGDLSGWARQGVLMLNSVLTVRANNSASHAGHGWERFTDAVVRAVLERHRTGLVFLLWGGYARSKGAGVGDQHHVIACPHPSPLSANRGFFGSRSFSRCNAALVKTGRSPIDWQVG